METTVKDHIIDTPNALDVGTEPPPPGEIKIDSVESDSVSLSWGSPENMDGIPHSFYITYSSSDRSHQDYITAPSNSTVISKLRPGREYTFTVTTVLENGTQSMPVSTAVCTKAHPPGEIKIDSVRSDSVSLSWDSPDNMEGIPHSFYITYSSSDRSHQDSITAPSNSTVISKLRPGREYTFTVITVLMKGTQSMPVSTAAWTKPSPNGEINIDSVGSDCVSVSWDSPDNMEGIPHSFYITYSSSDESHQDYITATSNSTVISKLRPGREYTFTVTTELENGIQSMPVSTAAWTKPSPPGVIKLDSVGSDSVSLSWESPEYMDGIPHSFHITYSSSDESQQDSITAPSNSTVISELRPGREYTFTVTTELENGIQSLPVSTYVCTKPPTGEITIDSMGCDYVSLSWDSPENMDGTPHSFYITYSTSDRSHHDSITAPSNSTVISELRPGRQYTFTLTTELENGTQSMPVSTAVCTKPSPPGEINIDSVEMDSVSLTWVSPDNMEGIPHSFYITYSSSDRGHQDSITAPSNSTVISELRPGREYTFTVTTVLENGTQSMTVSTAVCTKSPPPGEIKIDSVESDSVSLSWDNPDNMEGIPHSFYITYSSSDESHQDYITAPSNSTIISELRPGREYTFTVTTELENGTQSTPGSTAVCTKPSPPGEIKLDSVRSDSVSLSWESPENMDGIPHSFHITYSSSDRGHQDSITAPFNSSVISKLRPGREYTFTVTTELENGIQSLPVSTYVCTKPPPPGEIKIDSVESDSVSLSWDNPDNMDGIPHSFYITYSSSDESHQDYITAPSNSTIISELRPGREYTFTVTTELENGTQSTPVSTAVCTKPSPPGVIKLDSVGSDSVSLSWESPENMDGIPHSFHITYSSSDESQQDSITAPSNYTVISKLRPGREYTFTVTTELENGIQSLPVSTYVCTKPPTGEITIDSVGCDSVSLSWDSPENMDGTQHSFYITYSSSDRSHHDSITAPSNSTAISELRPGRQYTFTVTTELENGTQSMPVSTAVCTKPSPPGEINIDSVEMDSVSLTWVSPDNMEGIPHSFYITYSSSDRGHQDSITAPSNSTVISELRPGREYTFTVTTELENGTQSKPVSTAVCTSKDTFSTTQKPPPPGEVKIDSVESDSVSLSWGSPDNMEGIPHSFYITYSSSDKSHQDYITAPSNSTIISELRPGREYTFTVTTEQENGTQSTPVSTAVCTKPSPPGVIKLDSVGSDSVSLSWGSPENMDGIPHSFYITYSSSDRSHQDYITAPSNSTVISELRPGREYTFTVTTVLENGTQSMPVSTAVCTKPPPPGEIKLDSVRSDSVSLSWGSPDNMEGIPHSFYITYSSSDKSHQDYITAPSNSTIISELRPGREYTFTVTTEQENGTQSTPVSTAVCTKPSPPGVIKLDSVGSDSVSLSWGSPENMDGIPHSFYITYSSSDRSHQDYITAPSNSTVISELRPGREYTFTVTTVLENGTQSMPVSTAVCTKPSPPGEIKLDSVRSDSVSLSWESPENMDGIPHSFHITYSRSDESQQDSITAPSNSTVISKLRPGREYTFTVTTELENGILSLPVSTYVCTKPPPPGKVKIDSVESDSVSLSWGSPDNMEGIPHSFYITYSSSDESHQDYITAPSNSTIISELRPGREYTFTVTTELENGTQSMPVSAAVYTKPSPPGEIKIDSMGSDSASLRWDSPENMDGIPHSFYITYSSSDESHQDSITAPSKSTVNPKMRPGREYTFTVPIELENGTQSMPVSTAVWTKPPPPGEIKIDSVGSDFLSLSWGSPDNMDGTPHSFYITYSSSDESHQDYITAPSNSTVISELRPGREYTFTVTTELENGTQSMPVSAAVYTKPSPPGEIKIDSMGSDSVLLSWESPENMDGIPHSFHITYSSSDESHQNSITAPSNTTVISKLRPGREYTFTVTTELENGTQSMPVSTVVWTKPPPPGEIKIDSVESDSVSLSWDNPDNMDGIPHSFYITYSSSDESHQDYITAPSNSTVISELRPGREYTFTVTTELENGTQSMPVSTAVCTNPSPPGEIKTDSVEMDSLSLSWGSPDNMDGIPHSFHITYSSSDRSHQDSITAPSNSTVISKLRPGREYTFTVTTVLENGTQSMPASTAVCTKPSPPGEIKIDSVGSDSVSLNWDSPDNMDGIPHSFYITHSSSDESQQDSITAPSNSTVISKLRPGREYTFTVTTVLENGTQSMPVSTAVCTRKDTFSTTQKPPPPGEIKIDSVESDSVSLSWGSPDNMDEIPHTFYITYSSSDESHQDSITAPSNSTVISKLRPGREYTFTVTTELENGTQSMPVSTAVCTKPPPPVDIKIESVGSDSVFLSWDSPHIMDGIPHSFYMIYSISDRSHQDSITAPSNSTAMLRPGTEYTFTITTELENGIQSMPTVIYIIISKLRPGREYTFTVTTELENGTQSMPVSTAVCTKPAPPGEIKIDSVESDSVSLSWGSPDNMDEIPHTFYITYSSSDESHQDYITAPSNSTVISKLRPGREYTFTVTTELENGIQSLPVSTYVCTKPSTGEIKIDSVGSDSVSLSWDSPDNINIDGIPHSFYITYSSSDSSHQDSITAPSNSTVISKLRPGREYTFTVTTELENGTQSMPVSTAVCTKPPPPGEVKIDSLESDSVSLSWGSPDNMDGIPHSFYITYSSSDKSHQDSITAPSNSTVISKLRPGREYTFTVTTELENGTQSMPVSTAVCTNPSPPGEIKTDSVEMDSLSLSWDSPENMGGIPHSFYITYSSSDRSHQDSITAPSNSTVISKLRPGREYTFTVTTELENGIQSMPVSTAVCTKPLQAQCCGVKTKHYICCM
ncbi:tenascin-X-like isoform X2 [Acipenser ruthenus]|uniref:tenascin-X-like isoform X2 n=1 Tax=Acipenser ruthenus TaxID=7906 RepID=UPI0027420D08|nr:tenascin-X-like isoform X2 [Acipenser ruthenus]